MNTTPISRFGSQRDARLRANDLIALAAEFAGVRLTYGSTCGRTFRARIAAERAVLEQQP